MASFAPRLPSSRLALLLGLFLAGLVLLAPPSAGAGRKGARGKKALPTLQSRCGELLRWDAAARELLASLEAKPERFPEGRALTTITRALPGIVELGAIAGKDPASSEEVKVAGGRLGKAVESLKEPLRRKYAPLVGPALRRLVDSFEVIRPACVTPPGSVP